MIDKYTITNDMIEKMTSKEYLAEFEEGFKTIEELLEKYDSCEYETYITHYFEKGEIEYFLEENDIPANSVRIIYLTDEQEFILEKKH